MRKSFAIDRYNWDYSLEHYVRCQKELAALKKDLEAVSHGRVYNFILGEIDLVERIIEAGFSKVIEVENSFPFPEPRWIPCTYLEMLEPEKIKQHNLELIERWS